MTRYHPILVTLHWVLALMILAGLFMGNVVLSETPNDDPFKLIALRMHMSAGIAILVLMLIRLVVRFTTAKPPEADIGNPLLNTLGRITHWLLYLVVIALAASGLATANMAGLPPIVFGGSGDPLPPDFSAFPPRAAHGALGALLGLLLLGHVGAALYHQYVRRDGIFGRMWFGQRDG